MVTREETVSALQNKAEQLNISLNKLSKMVGMSHSYIHKFCTEGKPQQLPMNVAIKLSKILEMPMSYFTSEQIELSDDTITLFKYFIVFLQEENIPISEVDVDQAGTAFADISKLLPERIKRIKSTFKEEDKVTEESIRGIAMSFLLQEMKSRITQKIEK